jgi:hypothetical protein
MKSHEYDPATQQRQPGTVRPSLTEAPYTPSTPPPEPFAGRGPTKILNEPAPLPDSPTGTIPLLGVKEDPQAGDVGEGSSGLDAIGGKVPWQAGAGGVPPKYTTPFSK